MPSKSYSFEAQTSEILELLTHSVYSDKEVFLRELLSNASDAIDKARIKSLTDTNYLGDDAQFRIRVSFDEKTQTVMIDDNGIGMTEKEVKENIGTIAHSGTKKFVDKLKKSQESHLIGQFGIGFYSAFIVADKVTIDTKTAKGKAVLWESDGKGEYSIDAGSREARGTLITLHLKKEEEEFAGDWRLRTLIKKYSNFIPVPIQMRKKDEQGNTKDAWEQINETKAIWERSKTDVKEEEYKEFYTSISFEGNDPLTHLHLNIEGAMSFKALLYIPKAKPFHMVRPDEDYGPKLYSQKVLILENSKELLPVWLRFVKGVVETSEISLNVSREMLQNDQTLAKIQKNLIKKVLDELKKIKEKDPEGYAEFHDNFGDILKEGIHYDGDNKEKIAENVLFHSLAQDKKITLTEYVEGMTKEQNFIFYLTGSDLEQLKNSPYLEQITSRGYDVLLMPDAIDEWVVQALPEFEKIKLMSVASKDLELGSDEEIKEEKEKKEEKKKGMGSFLQHLTSLLPESKISEVDLTDRLKDSPAVLTTEE